MVLLSSAVAQTLHPSNLLAPPGFTRTNRWKGLEVVSPSPLNCINSMNITRLCSVEMVCSDWVQGYTGFFTSKYNFFYT